MKRFHFLAALVAAMLSFTDTSAQTTVADSLRTTVIRVTNLHCNGDMPTIRKRLLNQEGIDEVSFTDRKGAHSTFTIQYHSSATTEATIEQVIESTPGCDDQSETPYRVLRERTRKKGGS